MAKTIHIEKFLSVVNGLLVMPDGNGNHQPRAVFVGLVYVGAQLVSTICETSSVQERVVPFGVWR